MNILGELRKVSWLLLAVGASSFFAQICLLREVFALSRGNELMLGAVLGGWLALTGAWARVGGRLRPLRHRLGFLLALAPLLFQCSLWLLALGRPDGDLPGEMLGPLTEFTLSLLAILPATVFAGMAYSLAIGIQGLEGVGTSYASENLGAALAGGLFHFLLAGRVSSVVVISVAGAGMAAMAIPILWQRHRAVGLVLPLAMVMVSVPLIHDSETTLVNLLAPGETIVTTAHSRFGRLVVVAREGRRAILQNGMMVAVSEDQNQAEESVHLPLLLHPAPRTILVVGACLSHSLVEVLRHRPMRVHCLEMDAALVTLARAHLEPAVTAALSDPRVTVFETDAREHLREFHSAYDLVLLGSMGPRSPYMARLLTVESLWDARRSLKPTGLLSLVTPGRPAQLDPSMRHRHAMILATLKSVFPHVGFSPGEQSHFWAGLTSPHIDARSLAQRLDDRRVVPTYVGETWFMDRLLPFHLGGYEKALAKDPVPPNHELRPGMYLAGMVEDLAPSLPWLAQLFCHGTSMWWLVLPLLMAPVIFCSLKRIYGRPGLSPSIAAMVVGASGMAMSILVLMWFQSIRGHLYHSLGGLFGLFMLGMVIGARLGDRLAPRRRGLAWACAINAAIPAVAIAGLALARSFPFLALGVSLILCILIGTGTALVYAPAVEASLALDGRSDAGARIYALDLLGSAIVAVGTCWIVLPLLGFHMVALLASLACATATFANLRFRGGERGRG